MPLRTPCRWRDIAAGRQIGSDGPHGIAALAPAQPLSICTISGLISAHGSCGLRTCRPPHACDPVLLCAWRPATPFRTARWRRAPGAPARRSACPPRKNLAPRPCPNRKSMLMPVFSVPGCCSQRIGGPDAKHRFNAVPADQSFATQLAIATCHRGVLQHHEGSVQPQSGVTTSASIR